MLRLSKIVKSYKETGALNENVSVYGFLDSDVFLTKGGDVGLVLRVEGVDYECLDHKQTDSLTKRLESALRLLGSQFRAYQLLVKSSGETIPHGTYDNSVVRQAVDDRAAYFEKKAGQLYSLRIYYAILYEGGRHQTKLGSSLQRIASEPKDAVEELKGFLSSKKQTLLIGSVIEKQHRMLLHQVRSLILQLSDFVKIDVCDKQEAFAVLKRLLNFSPAKIEHARLKYDTHVDYYLTDSALECYTSRFASSVSLSYRPSQASEATKTTVDPAPQPALDLSALGIPNLPPALTGTAVNAGPSAAPTALPQAKRITPNFNQADGKDYVIFEGTFLQTAGVTRLNGDFSGYSPRCRPTLFIRTTASGC